MVKLFADSQQFTIDNYPAEVDIEFTDASLFHKFSLFFYPQISRPWEIVSSLRTTHDNLSLRAMWYDTNGSPDIELFLHDENELGSLTRMPWQADVICELKGEVILTLHIRHSGFVHVPNSTLPPYFNK